MLIDIELDPMLRLLSIKSPIAWIGFWRALDSLERKLVEIWVRQWCSSLTSHLKVVTELELFHFSSKLNTFLQKLHTWVSYWEIVRKFIISTFVDISDAERIPPKRYNLFLYPTT